MCAKHVFPKQAAACKAHGSRHRHATPRSSCAIAPLAALAAERTLAVCSSQAGISSAALASSSSAPSPRLCTCTIDAGVTHSQSSRHAVPNGDSCGGAATGCASKKSFTSQTSSLLGVPGASTSLVLCCSALAFSAADEFSWSSWPPAAGEAGCESLSLPIALLLLELALLVRGGAVWPMPPCSPCGVAMLPSLARCACAARAVWLPALPSGARCACASCAAALPAAVCCAKWTPTPPASGAR